MYERWPWPQEVLPRNHLILNLVVAFHVLSALGAERRAWLGSSDQPNQPDVLLMRNKRPCSHRAETWWCVNILKTGCDVFI